MPCVREVREKGKDFTLLLLVPTSGTRSREVGREGKVVTGYLGLCV